jgi:agmatine/peptidylarginine deiminase
MSRPRSFPSRKSIVCILSILCCGISWQTAWSVEPPQRRMPAEFEPQEAILIGWTEEDPIIRHVLIEIVQNVSPHVPVMILVDDETERAAADLALQSSGVRKRSIHLVQIPGDTIWLRDFGPLTVYRSDRQAELLNHEYADGKRPWDDRAPASLARMLRMPLRNVPLMLEGGNLLSNGQGLILTSSKFLEQNTGRGLGPGQLIDRLQNELGARQTIVLEPLDGEPTGHVDMFAAFLDANTVVLGQYDRRLDDVNAEILDRNARRLEKVSTAGGRLRVIRIPMPPHRENEWPTYTNMVFADGVVLVPVYAGIDPQGRAAALSTLRRLMPDRRIISIDCRDLIRLGGALHCITMNVGRIGNPRMSSQRR